MSSYWNYRECADPEQVCGGTPDDEDGTFYVEVCREGHWDLVGQYTEKRQADLIADDYRKRGETARVVRDTGD